MRARPAVLAAAAGLLLFTAACGAPGSSTGGDAATTSAAPTDSALPACEPIAGDKLVVLEDDQ